MSLLFQLAFLVYLLATAAYAVFFVSQNPRARDVARWVLLAGAGLHTAYFSARWLAAGHPPLTTGHEAVSFFAWSVCAAFLSFRWRYRVKNFGLFVSVVVSLLMLVAALSSREMTPLAPALQSKWMPIHAGVAILANGFFALAFCGGIMYLLAERELKSKKLGLFFERFPSLEALDNLNRHCLAVGFPLLTLGIITGSVWAKQAWGAYWQWDPKETWSLITWLIYAAILHQRLTVGWRRRRAAIMAIVGFSAVLFTLWGVTYLLGGVHSYAG
ncbi:MAG: c-type cytochrome biogenesis protein CcsB [Thermodesulfobacteriota bacterium]